MDDRSGEAVAKEAHVVFIDLVGSSLWSLDVQVRRASELMDFVRSLEPYRTADEIENAVAALQPQAPAAPSKELEAKVEALEKQVAKKDAVIAWVTEEHVKLKKALGEP